MFHSNASLLLRNKKKREKGLIGKIQFATRVEKEYLKPTYSASISEELEDGLFDGNVPSMEYWTNSAVRKLR